MLPERLLQVGAKCFSQEKIGRFELKSVAINTKAKTLLSHHMDNQLLDHDNQFLNVNERFPHPHKPKMDSQNQKYTYMC